MVANKDQLLYRQNEQFQPQAIRDTLPILLGALSHDRCELESKLRTAQRDLRINTKQLELVRNARDTSHETAVGLYSELRRQLPHGIRAYGTAGPGWTGFQTIEGTQRPARRLRSRREVLAFLHALQ